MNLNILIDLGGVMDKIKNEINDLRELVKLIGRGDIKHKDIMSSITLTATKIGQELNRERNKKNDNNHILVTKIAKEITKEILSRCMGDVVEKILNEKDMARLINEKTTRQRTVQTRRGC